MAPKYALLPLDASDDELEKVGVDPALEREVPRLGYVHSDDVDIWVGIEPVSGLVDLNGAAHGDYRTWAQRALGNETAFVNTERLATVRLG